MKKMGLFLCGFLFLLLLAGCNASWAAPTKMHAFSDLSYLRYPGTDWGMTPTEYFAARGEREEAYAKTQLETNGLPSIYYSINTQDFFGNPVQLRAEFTCVHFDDTQRLTRVVLGYEESFDTEALVDYRKRLIKLLEKQGAELKTSDPSDAGWWILYSAQTTGDFSPEIKEKLDQSYRYGVNRLGMAVGEQDSYMKLFGNRELSSVQVIKPDHEPGLYVSFSGSTIAMELGHLAVYEGMQEQ